MSFVILKNFKNKDGSTGYIHARIPCDCSTPEHALDLALFDDGMHFISVNVEEEPHLWCRVKNAFKCLVGKKVCIGEAVVTNEDLLELKKFIEVNIPSIVTFKADKDE